MIIEDFCKRISHVETLSNAQKAIAILWFFDQSENGIKKTSYELAKIIKDTNIGNPNPTNLSNQIKSTGCVYSSKKLFHLRQDKKAEVRSWVENILEGIPIEVPLDSQYLNEQVWKHTRGYIEKVCMQLNGAYHQGFYDCSAVMVRRIIETLIIEAYEHLKRESEIKDNEENYLMLGKLVLKTNDPSGLSLGRDAKKGLENIKKLGDRSAHNRRFNATKSDIDGIKDFLRITFQELANIAELYSK